MPAQAASGQKGGEKTALLQAPFRGKVYVIQTNLAVLPASRYFPNMSTEAMQQVVDELRGLPEADQSLVLGFLQALKRQRGAPPVRSPRRGRNPALKEIDGTLVFTGEIGDPNADWVQFDRNERDQEIIRVALDPVERR